MIQFLPFDTELFGYKVGRVADINHIKDILHDAKKDNYKLLYIKSDIELIPDITLQNLHLADKKITFTMSVEYPKNLMYPVDIYNTEHLCEDLVSLAYQSGEFSRFKQDRNFKNNEFEKLYYQWILRSIKKEIANYVFVCYDKNKIIGLLTLGVKKDRTDIGILAVDITYRGKKIGESLVAKAMQTTRDLNFQTIQVATQKDNVSACRFYEKQGFVIEKTEYIYHLWI